MIVCSCSLITAKDVAEAVTAIRTADPLDVLTPVQNVAKRPANWDTNLVAFMKSLEPLMNEFWNRALSMTDVDYYPPRFVVVPAGEVVMTGCIRGDGEPAQADAPESERKHIYDSTLYGYGNGGHPFGDHLDDGERRAVLEYLKTL